MNKDTSYLNEEIALKMTRADADMILKMLGMISDMHKEKMDELLKEIPREHQSNAALMGLGFIVVHGIFKNAVKNAELC